MQQRSFGVRSARVRRAWTDLLSLALAGLTALGCGGDVTPPVTPPPAVDPLAQIDKVTLIGPDSLLRDSTAQYALDLRDSSGQPVAVPSSGIAWKFDSSGTTARVREIAPGRIELTARTSGAVVDIEARLRSWSAARRVRLVARSPRITRFWFCCGSTEEPRFTVRVGDTLSVYFSAFDSTDTRLDSNDWPGMLGALPWTAADDGVATVAGHDMMNVRVRGVAVGETTIQVRRDGAAATPMTIRVIPPLPTLAALPARVEGSTTWTEIAPGTEHTCALATDGSVWCWGSNGSGALGGGPRDTAMTPRRATVVPVAAVSLGSYESASCAAAADDAVYCWGGSNAVTKARQLLPSGMGGHVASVAMGGGHACALTSDGQVACWGYGDGGQLGPGGTTTTCFNGMGGFYACRADAQRMETDLRFTSLAAGATFTCGLIASGDAYCWGNTALGGPTPMGEYCTSPGGPYAGSFEYACRRTPLLVTGDHRFRMLAAYGGRACGVATEGTVWCWTEQKAPVVVGGLQDVRSVSVGMQHACALLADGGVRCWGDNSALALGVPSSMLSIWPVAPVAPVGPSVRVSVGVAHSCTIGRDGAAVCWGVQRGGQLGRGSFAP